MFWVYNIGVPCKYLIMAEPTKSKQIEFKDAANHQRSEVIHDTIVLQLKLIVDGFRDLVLLPVCLGAGIWGLIRHQKNPGRYLYRVLSYGKLSEKWIGLFDEADKDIYEPLDYQDKKFHDLLQKTQDVFESKYVDPAKKEQLLEKFNLALNDINGKLKPKSTRKKPEPTQE